MKTIFTLLLIFAVCCSLNAQNLNKHLNVDVNIKKKSRNSSTQTFPILNLLKSNLLT